MKLRYSVLLLLALFCCSGCGSGGHSAAIEDRNPVYQDQPPAPPENRPYPLQKESL